MLNLENKLTPEGIVEIDKKFDEFLVSPADKEIFLETVSEKIQVDEEAQFEDLASYQRWYTFLVWQRLSGYKAEEFIKIFSNYFHIALLLGNDVWFDLLLFLLPSVNDLVEKVDIYKNTKQSLQKSKAIIAKMGNKNYTFSDILEICKDKIKDNDDVEGLKIILRPIIFCPEIDALDKYYVFDREKILENYIKFIKNILVVEKEEILKAIDKEFHPEFANDLKTVEEYNILVEEEKIKKSPETKINQKIEKPSYAEIKAKILQFFPKDENGEITDIEGVFEVLEKTADKYNDEKIKELYYYNEATEKFEWGI